MKSNKETVYEFIKRYSNSLTAQEQNGLSTQYLSEKLRIQRTNISSILNILVEEDLIEKSNGRPVLYRLKEANASSNQELSCFKNLIGYNSSLRNAVQLAKAAILYPKQSLSSLIVGPSGTGKSYFARLMFQFAVDNGILAHDAPFIKVNCKHYVQQEERMDEELFGENGPNLIDLSTNGVLFIDHVQLLSVSAKARLFDMIENHRYAVLDSSETRPVDLILICACNDDTNKMILETIIQKFPIRIDLLALSQRTMEERFQLIQHFFTMEAARTQRVLTITSEVLRNLLLYEVMLNVKQLKNDIQIGCANAYVREYNLSTTNLNVYISDFDHYVRKGFLNYKAHREINMEKTELVESELKKQSVYELINTKITELQDRGIPQKDINLIVSVEMENAFKLYQNQLSKQVVNKDQLSKLVDPKIIAMVESFLNEAALKFNLNYPVSVFYGLSLHLSASLKRTNGKQTLSNEQIMDVVEKYKNEYAFCLSFASKIETEFKVRLPIDEVVLITLFVVETSVQSEVINKPVVLIAMHGNATATSIAGAVNALVKGDNTYAYDLSLDKNTQDAYSELKETLTNIDRGKGIIVIYDMGSIKTMCEMVAAETKIKMKLIHMPVTLVALDAARKATMEDNLENLYDGVIESMAANLTLVVDQPSTTGKPILITLCSTGEGGAIQIKDYLIKHLELTDSDIIPLAISDRTKLQHEIEQIRKKHPIKAMIGTYRPKGFDIPFIPISRIFESDPASLHSVIDQAESEENIYSTQAIYDYLDEQLEFADVKKIEKILPGVMREINLTMDGGLSQDQKLGLFIHIACSINRLLAKEKLPVNLQKELIMTKYSTLFKAVLHQFRTIEKSFGVIFSDDEIANVITIIKKL
jgi:transcriptional regulatory protein LevR/transcriptional regulator with AAA-type ATPase domain